MQSPGAFSFLLNYFFEKEESQVRRTKALAAAILGETRLYPQMTFSAAGAR